LRIMKLTTFLLLISVLGVWANKSYSQTLSLNIEKSSVKEVLSTIEDMSDFSFLYSEKFIDVSRRVSVKVEDKRIEDILELLFEGTDVNFERKGKLFILSTSGADSVSSSLQQPLSVSGKVTDSSGDPLPGVTVIIKIKGTTQGTITDVDGEYTLAGIPGNGTLIFSFVGMKTQEIPVAGKTTIDVTLAEESIGLEEVVAVGYGYVPKKSLTGAVASVRGDALKDIPVTSASQAIAGRMPGVQVTRTEGSPDADIKIRIRGGGSITQDNSPLFIVDGFPVDNINDIAVNDIESIDVLKDASSTAIYGSRGANGVIIVTTKSGVKGKGKISYNTYFGVKEISNKNSGAYDMLSPYEFILWMQEYRGTSFIEEYYGDPKDYALYKQLEGHDWFKEIAGSTGTSMNHNLAFSGGTKTSSYNISLTRTDEDEIMISSGYERTNLSANFKQDVNKWLTINLSTRLVDYKMRGAGGGIISTTYMIYRPIDGINRFVDTSVVGQDDALNTQGYFNPISDLSNTYRRKFSQTFNYNGSATIKFTKNLSFKLAYTTQNVYGTGKIFYGIGSGMPYLYGEQPLASISKSNNTSSRLSNTLTYSKKDFLPGSNLNIVAGQELFTYKSEYLKSSAKYFPKYIDAVSALAMMQLGIEDPVNTIVYPTNKLTSAFARASYDYKGKYLASVTFRADGSSKFAPGNQWGYFPAAGLAWRMSDEKFMSLTKKWLDDLKFRLSYGEAGNNRITDNAWNKVFSVEASKLFLDGDGVTNSATAYLYPSSILSNRDLRWETTITRNGGVDFSLLKQRLRGSVELYHNTTKDLLIQADIPTSSGYSTQWQNIGQTSNKGIEIQLDSRIVDKEDFSISASFNIAFNKGRIDKLGETKSYTVTSGWVTNNGPVGDYLVEEGGQVGTMYGYETEGMYSFDDFDYDSDKGTYALKEGVSNNFPLIMAAKVGPGFLKLKDQNGDFVVDELDKVVLGNSNPKHTGGFNLTVQYKGFDCSAFFNWVYGNKVYNATKLRLSNSGITSWKNILNIMNSDNRFTYLDKETGTNVTDPTRLAEINANATIWSANFQTVPLHSWGVEDGSFLRLNNLTIGYSLPKTLLKKVGISKLRVYATGYNLWLWTNYSGQDPEVDMMRSNPLTPGIDWFAYPKYRSFNVGLNLEF
ncbi:MAG: TonB-dependent receptor, partial [Bacteroidales bacterium]|nr:TonB-dependent receptor [Bacteroidales bacterium]